MTLDYEQSLFFLGPSSKTCEIRKWPRAWLKAAALVSRLSRLRRSTLALACTPLTKSEEKERLLAVYGDSNSDNSLSPPTRTKFLFPWITRMLVLGTHHECQPFAGVIGKTPKTDTAATCFHKSNEQITYLTVISLSIIIRIHNRVTISDELSLVCTLLFTEVLKYH